MVDSLRLLDEADGHRRVPRGRQRAGREASSELLIGPLPRNLDPVRGARRRSTSASTASALRGGTSRAGRTPTGSPRPDWRSSTRSPRGLPSGSASTTATCRMRRSLEPLVRTRTAGDVLRPRRADRPAGKPCDGADPRIEFGRHGDRVTRHGSRPVDLARRAVRGRELVEAREVLSTIVDRPISDAACPLGRYDRSVLAELRRLGYSAGAHERSSRCSAVRLGPTAVQHSPRRHGRVDPDDDPGAPGTPSPGFVPSSRAPSSGFASDPSGQPSGATFLIQSGPRGARRRAGDRSAASAARLGRFPIRLLVASRSTSAHQNKAVFRPPFRLPYNRRRLATSNGHNAVEPAEPPSR